MSERFDFSILGGGISGLLTAYELSQAGFSVCVIDISAVGRESSWAGGGILLPLYPWRQAESISDLVIASLALYPDLITDLVTQSHINPEFIVSGLLLSTLPDRPAALDWCRRYQIRYQLPTPDAPFHPALQCQLDQPLWLPDIAQARNPRLLKALKATLQQRDVVFFEHCQVHTIHHQNQHITHLQTQDKTIATGHLVVTAGAWTSTLFDQLLPDITPPPAIKPIKGQMLLFDSPPGLLPFMVLANDRYLIPRQDGKILVGSTVEDTGFDKQTSDTARQQLYQFATTLLPALEDYPVGHHWAGLRPGTDAGVPCISLHPDIDNLSINAGHFRNGLGMGPASAKLLADLILERSPLLNPEPYQLKSL
ncbi:NAD(P)/FAD-dependent oxidoreductase [methane-oxidizing endosymbiont of Gigantopelta aegis]|uniref:NAD(P)/FAD-dependent oxidoreductase n=1 Tax=methane-oxidizing endosymbiont of Gigantopelta aegis TaxID=2794938 RepID=UPI0018DDAFC3|nr:FAD-dependent oxidoreductase [methane-oxidizing endosymbiont of Gigantopelta aegis]